MTHAVFDANPRFSLQIGSHWKLLCMTDEQALIERAQADAEGVRELYRCYLQRVYAYVAYRVGRVQDTEDIVAEIFLKVINGLSGFEYRGPGAFSAWLFRIAHNEVNQFYRQRHIQITHISLDDLPEIHAESLAPDQALMRKEQFAHLRTLIAALPDRRREIITLRFFGGLRNQEIATVLGLDERTIASHLCRALDDLRRQYRAEEEQEA